jgi:hypothetical protein
MVLTYKGVEFFFVDGAIASLASGVQWDHWYCCFEKGCFLIAVGQSAVKLLSDDGQMFRLIVGSTELAVFSVFRRSAFTEMLIKERK